MVPVWFIPVAVFIAWMGSHVLKELLYIYRFKKFSWYTLLLETGGMPSSHSSSVSALTTSIYFLQGFSVLFWVSAVFSAIVIRDAFGMRKSISDQARVLNILTSHVHVEKKVRVVLGHTPLQALVGVIIGVLLTWMLWAV